MIEIFASDEFVEWFEAMRDRQTKARIQARIDRASLGNFGDSAPVGEGISEMRIHHGPGYRVYFMARRAQLVILLCGGDKSRQPHDIRRAKQIARQWKDDP